MNGCIGKEAGGQMTNYASLCAHCPYLEWMKKCRKHVSMLKIVTKSNLKRDVTDSHKKYAMECFWKLPQLLKHVVKGVKWSHVNFSLFKLAFASIIVFGLDEDVCEWVCAGICQGGMLGHIFLKSLHYPRRPEQMSISSLSTSISNLLHQIYTRLANRAR